MKNILLFGAGKSATGLIDYLSRTCQEHKWLLTVADADPESLNKKMAGLGAVQAVRVQVQHPAEWQFLVEKTDLVISLLPPNLHILIARSCLHNSKNLLTASYVNDQIRSLEKEVADRGLFFLCEMGLDPGIDHMSAMLLIDRIHKAGGNISSFRSHTGGLVAPESDDNPWHYKISWNPRNVVRAGSAGAVFKENHQIRQIGYKDIFENTGMVRDPMVGTYAFYPNRDSLEYMSRYGLQDVDTFIRTTLRHPDFCRGWKDIVAAGLTDDRQPVSASIKTMADWSYPLLSYVNDFNRPLFDFLGLFDQDPLPGKPESSADLLQQVIEKKWEMRTSDKDMIVMLHEIEYTEGHKKHGLKSSLVVKGEDNVRTAMAKTVGLPLGITARLILENKISLRGLHIPIIPEIYLPVLKELETLGVRFYDTAS